MPKRHRNRNPLYTSTDDSQYKCSLPPLPGGRRAPPAVPGRIPLREEAELFPGVTKASAEPETGAILFGPLGTQSGDFSPQHLEADFGISRVVGMGQLSDGLSRPSSSFINPLRNNPLELPPSSNPCPSGDKSMERPFADSGQGPTTNDLSGEELNERQEGAKEFTTNPDLTHTDLIINSTLIDHNMWHQSLFTDKVKIISHIYFPSFFVTHLIFANTI